MPYIKIGLSLSVSNVRCNFTEIAGRLDVSHHCWQHYLSKKMEVERVCESLGTNCIVDVFRAWGGEKQLEVNIEAEQVG